MEFLQTHSLYVVAIIAVIIWLGLFVFMLSVSRRVVRLERQRKEPVRTDRARSNS